VYRTDAENAMRGGGAGALRLLELPRDLNVTAEYAIAVTTTGSQPGLARAFVAFLRSDVGRAILAKHGFEPVH
jgi:ABC-type molybdate transport system substrate-binding protein